MTALLTKLRVTKTSRRWTTGGLLALLIIVNQLDRGNLSIAIPSIRKDLPLTNLQVGMILGAFQWTYAISNIPMGLIVDRFGPRRVVAFAGLVWTLCAAATGLMTSLVGLVAMRACLGVSESPIFPAGIKVVDAWFPNTEKAAAVAMYEVAVQIGMTGAPLLGALLVVQLGWRTMFVAVALLSLVPLLFWFLRYRRPEEDGLLAPEERALILAGRETTVAAPPSVGEWGNLFRYVQTWAMMAGGFSYAGMMAFYLWLPIYLQQTRHFSIMRAGGSLALLGLVGIAGVTSGALLSDFLIRRGLQVLAARRLLVTGGALLGGAAITYTAFYQSDATMLIAIGVGSFASGLMSASWWALVPAIAPDRRLVASLGSLQNGGAYLGAAIAPLVIGKLLDTGFTFHAVLAISSAFAAVCAVIYGILLRDPMEPHNANQRTTG
jgi:sugar phosphate permease